MMSSFFILTLNDLALRSKVKVNFAPNREVPSFCKQILEGVTPFLCHKHMQQEMLKAQQSMLATLETNKVLKTMAEFDQKKEAQSPLFKFVQHYMRMVLLTHSSVLPAIGFESFACHPSMHCANTSLLMTSRSMQG